MTGEVEICCGAREFAPFSVSAYVNVGSPESFAALGDTASGEFVHQALCRNRRDDRRWSRSRLRFLRGQITGGYEDLHDRSVEDLACRPHRVLRGRALGRQPSTELGRSNLQRTRSFLDVAERAKFQLILDPCGETTHSGHIA